MLVAPDRAVRHRIIVQIGQGIVADLILGLVLDAAAVADHLPASCACCGHCWKLALDSATSR